MITVLRIAPLLLLGCVSALGCTPHGTQSRPATQANDPIALVLRSADNAFYREPADAFVSQLNPLVSIRDHLLPADSAWKPEIGASSPIFVFAAGPRSALWARNVYPNTPLIFSMVLNYSRIPDLQGDLVAGIALEVPVNTEFSQFRLILPQMKKVLALYHPEHSTELVTSARQQLQDIGIVLHAHPVQSSEEIADAYTKHRHSCDALWLLGDVFLMQQENFQILKNLTDQDKIPLVASFSERFAEAGALMSVSVDLASIGYQASVLAKNLLSTSALPDPPVVPPIGFKLVLNAAVANQLDIEVPGYALQFVGRIIDEEHDPVEHH